MKFYIPPCADWIKIGNGNIQTADDLLSVSTDNDLPWDWLMAGQQQILTKSRGE